MRKIALLLSGLLFPLIGVAQAPLLLFDASGNPYPNGSGSPLGFTPAPFTCYTNVTGTVLPCNFTGGGGPPSGPAGGDLSGTYPNPTVAQVNGAAVPTSAAFLASNGSKQLVAAAYTPAHSGANSDITSLTGLTTPLPVSGGGTGTATPGLTAGTGCSGFTGTWPNITINCAGTATGTVTDSAGTTTPNQVALSTSTLHQIQYSTALPNGITATTQPQGTNNNTLGTTNYTDTAIANAIAAVNPAVAVLAASTANIAGTYIQVGGGVGDTFTVTATGAFTLDGIAINTIGQRILLKNQSTASQNGVYFASVVGTTGISPVFTRAIDYDTPSDVNNTGSIPVQSGTANGSTSWLLTSQVTSIGSAGSPLTYTQFTVSPANLFTSAGGMACTGTPASGQVPTAGSATGCTWQTPTVPAAITFWAPGNGTGTAGAAFVQNVATGFGFALPAPLSVAAITYRVTTSDNTANLYNLAIYNLAGTLVLHTGPTAGTSFAPSNAQFSLAFLEGATTLAPGTYRIVATTNCASACAVIAQSTGGNTDISNGSSLGSTSGAVLPGSITPPSVSYVQSTTYWWFILHN